MSSVIFLDIWQPGEVTEMDGSFAVLTMLEGMCSFAATAFLPQKITAETLADATFSTFFAHCGMPRLIVVDADSKFCRMFKVLFKNLGIPVEAVSKGNHKAIRNERFHRYLNKVKTINTADTDSYVQWKQGVVFAVYGWNAGPIDGTNIPRSVGAMGREFPFPIDLERAPRVDNGFEGHNALDYIDAVHPLIKRQQDLLRILNKERRLRHRELKNEGVTERQFYPGNLVLVKKQVRSRNALGIAAKIVFKSRGPYWVMEQANPGSYWLQKLPFLEGLGVPGRRMKESAARMEKIPSTLILHKRPDGADTRFASLLRPLTDSPLQNWIGAIEYGEYRQAPALNNFAFNKIKDLWDEPLDDSDKSEEDVPEETPTIQTT
jgi:hypothetical protein